MRPGLPDHRTPRAPARAPCCTLLGGLLGPTSGEVWADGQPVSRWSAPHRERWRRRVGIVFQHLHLLNDITLLENVLLPCVPRPELLARRPQVTPGGCWNGWGWAHWRMWRPGGFRVASGSGRPWPGRWSGNRAFYCWMSPAPSRTTAASMGCWTCCAEAIDQGRCVVVCSHDPRLAASDLFQARYRLDQGRLELCP